MYWVSYLSVHLGFVELDIECSAFFLICLEYLAKAVGQNGETTKIQYQPNPTQVQNQMGHPVFVNQSYLPDPHDRKWHVGEDDPDGG